MLFNRASNRRKKFDNTKSIKGLGIQYKDAKETLVSHVEQLEKSNLIFNK